MIAGIITGILAGYIASKLLGKESKGCIVNLFVGLVGGGIGSWVLDILDITWGGILGHIGTAVIGAVILLWICNKVFK